MNRTILFCVSANSQIGMGHLMRCLSIADALRAEGISCFFVLETECICRIVKEHGFLCHKLENPSINSTGLEGELPELMGLIENLKPIAVIVDSYQVTKKYLSALMCCVKVVYIDDLLTFPYPCDILINYNIYAPDWEELYQREYQNKYPYLILGPAYAPLRTEFKCLHPKRICADVRHVLFSAGGADPENMTQRLLSLIQDVPVWEDIQFHMVIGAMNHNRNALARMAQSMPNVRLHVNVSNMAYLMQECDIAIAAAGSTLYELCACGTPTITYILADNQIPGAESFEKKGLMLHAGDCRKDGFTQYLYKAMVILMHDEVMRKRMSTQMKQTVDGIGAKRLAQKIVRGVSKR